MSRLRLIARLDVKGPNLIKGIQLEGVRKVGDPNEFATRYYADGADEILYVDAVASLYDRDILAEIVRKTAEHVFIPITVGGGIRSVDDAQQMLRAGADKIAVNSAVTQTPELISKIANRFGSQCMVLQIDAKRNGRGGWEAYRDGGREQTGLDVVEWAVRGQHLGAGEILLTSVDNEGMRRGYDLDLMRAVGGAVTIPVIASGGMGELWHLSDVAKVDGIDAVAMAYVLHYGKADLRQIRAHAVAEGLPVRRLP